MHLAVKTRKIDVNSVEVAKITCLQFITGSIKSITTDKINRKYIKAVL